MIRKCTFLYGCFKSFVFRYFQKLLDLQSEYNKMKKEHLHLKSSLSKANRKIKDLRAEKLEIRKKYDSLLRSHKKCNTSVCFRN